MLLTSFGDIIAARMRAEHANLASRWFERLSALLPVDAGEVFPTDSLLDHIPALIVEISEYLRVPEGDAIAANTAVLQKARELGALRHGQRASLHQVLREYQLLGGVLVSFLQEEIERQHLSPSPAESVGVASRLHAAVNVLMQTTVETFVDLYTRTISDQARRLEEFTRMATHEWRQPLGSLQFAVALLRRSESGAAESQRLLEVIDRNLAHLIEMTRKIEALARVGSSDDDPSVQSVPVGTIAEQAARQLREMAESRGVDVRIAPNMPVITIDVGRLELVLLNLLSNGIKYSDPSKPVRFVQVTASVSAGECHLIVSDNGLGIPADRIGSVLRRFSRAHADRDEVSAVSGVGLGLAIVDDCVRAVGGQITVESVEGLGTEILVLLPLAPPQTDGSVA